MVEALTIVVAVGVTRGWRSPMWGVGVAFIALTAIVAILGPALTLIPISALRLVVGGLLLIFGLQWLRKAILRASGWKALHDEDEIFAREREAARKAGHERRGTIDDWFSFTVSFKGVFLEGLEVAFIVVSFGGTKGGVPVAAAGAAVALVIVAITGFVVRGPLSRVPENALKFAVGTMLTTFGTFWAAEGAGAEWPGGDAAIVGVLGFVALVSLVLVRVMRGLRPAASAAVAA
jgi:uncharacterized membrane protein